MLAKASSSLFIMVPYSYSQFSLAGWQESQNRGDSPVTPNEKRNGQQLLEMAVECYPAFSYLDAWVR